MPLAGWCRECGEWVWVDDEGACQNGHGPECVGGVYDATPQELGEPQVDVLGFGSGEMPAELNRFNWGALLLPSVWGITFGVWPIVSLWLLSFMTPFVLVSLVGIGGEGAVDSAAVGITVVSQIIGAAISLYIGSTATAMLWRKERMRLELIEGSTPRFSVQRFVARQRLWKAFGIGLTVFSVMGLAVIGLGTGAEAEQVRTRLEVTQFDAASAFVWLVAEIVLGLWLAAQMRKEHQ